jgi:hypothetical protein
VKVVGPASTIRSVPEVAIRKGLARCCVFETDGLPFPSFIASLINWMIVALAAMSLRALYIVTRYTSGLSENSVLLGKGITVCSFLPTPYLALRRMAAMASEQHRPNANRQLELPGFIALNYGIRTAISVVLAHAALECQRRFKREPFSPV